MKQVTLGGGELAPDVQAEVTVSADRRIALAARAPIAYSPGMNDLPVPSVSNVPEYTVSEISGAVKRTLEGNFGRVRVRGEITELKRYPSGHIYFSLKDEGAKISGVSGSRRWGGWAWCRRTASRLSPPAISAYAERSSYQLITERMEYAGAGALLARIEMLRVRLAAEGLFERASWRCRCCPGWSAW